MFVLVSVYIILDFVFVLYCSGLDLFGLGFVRLLVLFLVGLRLLFFVQAFWASDFN